MPKFSHDAISNIACHMVYAAEDGFSCNKADMLAIEQVEFGAYLKRCLAEGKRRIVIDLAPLKK